MRVDLGKSQFENNQKILTSGIFALSQILIWKFSKNSTIVAEITHHFDKHYFKGTLCSQSRPLSLSVSNLIHVSHSKKLILQTTPKTLLQSNFLSNNIFTSAKFLTCRAVQLFSV